MRKVLVIGSRGSGKSTLAAQLGEQTGLPVIHLDSHYWRPGWVATPRDEWIRTVEALLERDAWIIDGHFGESLDLRLAACDTVIFLDVPRLVCLWRVLVRRVRYHGRSRPTVPEGCPARLDRNSIRWIWNFPRERRPELLRKLESAAHEKRVIVLKSRSDIARFLAAERKSAGSGPSLRPRPPVPGGVLRT